MWSKFYIQKKKCKCC